MADPRINPKGTEYPFQVPPGRVDMGRLGDAGGGDHVTSDVTPRGAWCRLFYVEHTPLYPQSSVLIAITETGEDGGRCYPSLA